MVKCSVISCITSRSMKLPGVSMHLFPANLKRRDQWLLAIGRPNFKPSRHSFICSKHFNDDVLNKTLNVIRLKDDAYPSLQLSANQQTSSIQERDLDPLVQNDVEITQPTNSSYSDALKQKQDHLELAYQDFEKLYRKSLNQKKKITSLTQKVRRQRERLDKYYKIIVELKKQNIAAGKQTENLKCLKCKSILLDDTT